MSQALVAIVVLAVTVGFLVGMLIGLRIIAGGRAEREKRRRERAYEAALERYPEFTTSQLRVYVEDIERSARKRVSQGFTYSDFDRKEAYRARRELSRRESAGEVRR